MILAVALSLFFGVLAGLSLLVCYRSGTEGLTQWRKIKAELALIDRADRPEIAPLRPRPAAFAQGAWRLHRERA